MLFKKKKGRGGRQKRWNTTLRWSLVNFGTFHDYYLHSAIIEGHCLIFMYICIYFDPQFNSPLPFQFPYEDMLMAHHLEKRWKRLFLSALYRYEKLQPIKQKFADMTSVEIDEFCDDVSCRRGGKGSPPEVLPFRVVAMGLGLRLMLKLRLRCRLCISAILRSFSAILFCFLPLLFPFNGILIGFFRAPNHYCQLLAATSLLSSA